MKIKNDDGTESEVFTPEEVDAKIKAVEETKQKEIQEVTQKVTAEFEGKMKPLEEKFSKMEAEKKDLEAKIAGEGQQGANFKVLKEALDKKTEELDAVKKDLTTFKESQFSTQRNAFIDKFAGKDPELKKKIEFHYKESLSAMSESTPVDMAKKVEAAFKLASDNFSPDLMDTIIGGGNRGEGGGSDNKGSVEFTQRERALGSKMGITEADYKKYGPKIK